MTDGDDDTPDESAEEAAGSDESSGDAADEESGTDVTAESLSERLDAAESSLEDAETEADLDEVEAELDAVESDLESADLPEPDDDDDDAEDPRADLESRLSDLRDDLESQRGPYAADAVENVESAQATLRDTRWTDRGSDEIVGVVDAFFDDLGTALDETFDPVDGDADPEALAVDLDGATEAIEAADLDPDEDAETVADVLAASDALVDVLDDAEEWDDLEKREQLQAQGYYDDAGHF